jgi:predicted HTH transcriptional regulator
MNKQNDAEDKKAEIIELLKREERCPTSKIAAHIGRTANYTRKYLEELAKDKKVIKEDETNSTYWKIDRIGTFKNLKNINEKENEIKCKHKKY